MSRAEAPTAEIALPAHFPVAWADPQDAQLFWTQDRMHYPDPVSPLCASFEFPAFNLGFGQASDELSIPIYLRYQALNGYAYTSAVPRSHDPTVMAELGRKAEEALWPAVLGLEKTWQEVVLPDLQADIATLRAFDYASASDSELVAHLDWVVARRAHHWYLHFLIGFPVFPAIVLAVDLYKQITGSTDETEPYTLTQGFSNKTVEGDHALWRLSRTAAQSPAVRDAIALTEPAAALARLEETPEGRAFAASFRAYLDEHGWRGDSTSIDNRTWVDYPHSPLANLRRYLDQPDDASPEIVHARLAREREAILARVRGQLASAPAELRGQFESLLSAAQTASVLQEDHNYYIDQTLQHLCRRAFTRAGARLVARGQLTGAEDVLYLTVDELREQLRVNPAIKARYFADPDPIRRFGLPMAYASYGGVFVVRAQRAVFQQWKVAVPWAREGEVVVANGGDVAKEAGSYPIVATVPHAPERSHIVSLLAGPGRLHVLETRWTPPQATGSPGTVRARLLTSDDLGQTWQPFAGGLPVAADCLATIGMDYATRDTLYASTCQGLYRWTGVGWEQVSTRPTGKIAVTYGDPQRLLTTEGGRIIRSVDGGATWSELGFPSVARTVGIDPRNARNIYVLIHCCPRHRH